MSKDMRIGCPGSVAITRDTCELLKVVCDQIIGGLCLIQINFRSFDFTFWASLHLGFVISALRFVAPVKCFAPSVELRVILYSHGNSPISRKHTMDCERERGASAWHPTNFQLRQALRNTVQCPTVTAWTRYRALARRFLCPPLRTKRKRLKKQGF